MSCLVLLEDGLAILPEAVIRVRMHQPLSLTGLSESRGPSALGVEDLFADLKTASAKVFSTFPLPSTTCNFPPDRIHQPQAIGTSVLQVKAFIYVFLL